MKPNRIKYNKHNSSFFVNQKLFDILNKQGRLSIVTNTSQSIVLLSKK